MQGRHLLSLQRKLSTSKQRAKQGPRHVAEPVNGAARSIAPACVGFCERRSAGPWGPSDVTVGGQRRAVVRLPLGCRQPCPCGGPGALDELVGLAEVRRQDVQGAQRRYDAQVHPGPVCREVDRQSVVEGQGERGLPSSGRRAAARSMRKRSPSKGPRSCQPPAPPRARSVCC